MNLVEILLGDVRVGEIERFGEVYDQHVLRFDSAYLRLPSRPVLGQLFEDRVPNEVVTTGLTPWFQHLLPPSGTPLRRAIARSAGVDDEDELEILCWLGEDLPGAVVVRPLDTPNYRRPQFSQLQLNIGPSPFRVALAGNQWKLSANRAADDRITIPLEGTGFWIAKFHGTEFPGLAQNEFAMMSWAAKSGIDVPQMKLVRSSDIENLPPEVPTGDGWVFMVERFDRTSGGRVHVEDFGQIFDCPASSPYGESFEAIAEFLRSEKSASLEEYVRRLIFMVLSGNADAHLKNWAISYSPGNPVRLTPAYDLVSTILLQHPKTLALSLAGVAERPFTDVSIREFEPIGRILEQPIGQLVSQAATRIREAWSDVASLLGATERARIEAHLSSARL